MTAADLNRVRLQLIHDEGLRLKPYKDTVGKLTIGVGRNLDDRGITQVEAMYLLDNDIRNAISDCVVRFQQTFLDLDPPRQAVLVNMCVNLGIARLAGFKKTLAAIKAKDYEGAAIEMLSSVWADQVGDRALRLADQMRLGEWPA